MHFFIIFDKRGVVAYEEGKRPVFLNNVIQALNTKQLEGSKNVQDFIVEHRVIDQYIFLCISKNKKLSELVPKFESHVLKLKPNEPLSSDLLLNSENSIAEEKPVYKTKNSSKNKAKTEDNSLNFSEQSSTMSIIQDAVTSFSFKRTFKLFSSKINIDELSSKMNDFLIRKNVDPIFSKMITDDVIFDLKLAGFSEVSENEFKERMSKTLSKMIPTIDHKAFIQKIKNHSGVFSICFVGVNGVGKSTSLAKIACWLLQNDLKVYIAACDTFRAGAIEQLKVHVERFNKSGHGVGFYESGYSKDDASVAKSAIIKANKENYDVILIDTAGRMHNKENLMQSLTKLIKTNEPNHILFVGEALVGSDSLDHIKEFNKRIREGCPGRQIDSILLTKVDTVDDKIGQILNLTFSSSSPLIFLGTGQSNKDLTVVNPEDITCSLLS